MVVIWFAVSSIRRSVRCAFSLQESLHALRGGVHAGACRGYSAHGSGGQSRAEDIRGGEGVADTAPLRGRSRS